MKIQVAFSIVVWAAAAAGCSGRPAPHSIDPSEPSAASDDASAFSGTIASSDATIATDSGVAPWPLFKSSGSDAGPGGELDEVSSPDDAGDDSPDGACASALTPGDLVIDELMIESVAGTGDHGEWLEVRSNLPCAANLRGLHGATPRGAKIATFDVRGDLWIPPAGRFVMADSLSPAINHALPPPVVAWAGNVGDVLRNKGSTVTLSLDGVVIDTVTYPALALTAGTSLAFPDDCDLSKRADFALWQPSVTSWFPGFQGTPNAPNTDVTCPM